MHLESATDVVIIDGTFSTTNDLTGEAFGRVHSSYLERYRDYQPESADGLVMIKPRSVLAWSQFPVDVTRFTSEQLSTRRGNDIMLSDLMLSPASSTFPAERARPQVTR